MYGRKIVLNYEGEQCFRTHIGALASLIIISLIAIYFILQLRVMFLKNNTSYSRNSLQKDLTNDLEVHKIGENHIMFGMRIDYNGDNLLADPSYFTYSLSQVNQVYVDLGSDVIVQRNKTTIPMNYCNFESFYQAKRDAYDRLEVDEHLCPTNTDFTVAANYYAPRFDYIELKVFRCNPSKSNIACKTNISNIMKQTKLNLMLANAYFDIDNFDQPVQYFLDDGFFWDLAPGFRKKTDIFVRKNDATLIDQYLQLGQSEKLIFYEIVNLREQILVEDTDLQIASVYFRFDSNFDSYTRRVYSFGDLLGQTGGLYSAVFFIGTVFVGIFSERLFVSSILKKIYQIDQKRDQEIKKAVVTHKGRRNSRIGNELQLGKKKNIFKQTYNY